MSNNEMPRCPRYESSETPRDDKSEHDTSGDAWDPERLMQCPFDKNHQIRLIRLPYHLVKCKKNHPELAKELRTCPFNATHLVHKSELSHHAETCEDRCLINLGIDDSSGRQCQWKVPVTNWVNLDSTEDWEKEVENAPQFVWGLNLLFPKNKPEVVTRIDPVCRKPNINPWV